MRRLLRALLEMLEATGADLNGTSPAARVHHRGRREW